MYIYNFQMKNYHIGTFRGSAAYEFVRSSNIPNFMALSADWEKNADYVAPDLTTALKKVRGMGRSFAIIVESPIADYVMQVS